MLPNDIGRANIKTIHSGKLCFHFFILFRVAPQTYKQVLGVMHQFGRAIHNLKKFFAFFERKYTLVVYKELSRNILLSKKENINNK